MKRRTYLIDALEYRQSNIVADIIHLEVHEFHKVTISYIVRA